MGLGDRRFPEPTTTVVVRVAKPPDESATEKLFTWLFGKENTLF